jgi:hypothetical protein
MRSAQSQRSRANTSFQGTLRDKTHSCFRFRIWRCSRTSLYGASWLNGCGIGRKIVTATIEELEIEAPSLSARLVEKRIASLDSEPDIENAWAEEVERPAL